MSLLLDLPQPTLAQLEREAEKAGLTPAAYASDLVARKLPPHPGAEPDAQMPPVDATIALLQSWRERANITATPEQIAESEADLAEFMQNMNATRLESGELPLYPMPVGSEKQL